MKNENSYGESLGFLLTLTFIGGYLDAYTYLVRGGVFASNMTANIAKFGIELSQARWVEALDVLYPMLATIAGAFFAEYVKDKKFVFHSLKWEQLILSTELTVLFLVGFVPSSFPHPPVNLTVSFIAAWQLNSFRSFQGWAHNTTISTGNLRSLGQYAYQAFFIEKSRSFKIKTAKYALLVFSFASGALLSAFLCRLFEIRAIWLCSILLAILVCRWPKREGCN